MSVRAISFIVAAAFLMVFRICLASSKQNSSDPARTSVNDRSSVLRLLLASFLVLFAELAIIRWIAVEVRVFAYFKNLTLVLCFLGFGLGCAMASKALLWRTGITAFLGLVLVVRLPFANRALEHISQDLGSGRDVEIWGGGQASGLTFLVMSAALATLLFILIVWIFVPLGQIVSQEMNRAPKVLSAYAWNLFGSLLGILLFLVVSRLMLPPSVWLSGVMIGFAVMQTTARERKLIASLGLPVALLLLDPSTKERFSIWTPYQQISYFRVFAPDGDLVGGYLQVNHTGYQSTVNLSSDFLEHHPKVLSGPPEENPYNLPFRFTGPSPTVLVVGAGTGNDVASALRHASTLVDAVEIDPAILAIGKKEHPEHPYDSPHVSLHLIDARAFLKRTSRAYDLILFGLLDSHTQFSDYSNMRIDNYVYTEESIREAKSLLKPEGILFIKFQVNHPWMSKRLSDMLQQVFGMAPLIFHANALFSVEATCFVISPSERITKVLSHDASLASFVNRNRVQPNSEAVPITNDDWPYLYQQRRSIPQTYIWISLLVLLMSLGLYAQLPGVSWQIPSLFFFSMGAGFLLLETQLVSRLALYFGTTWQVNGIAISCVLITLLAANITAERMRQSIRRCWLIAPLMLGLLGAYVFPFSRLNFAPDVVGVIVAAVFAIPVFFAGLLFSLELRNTESPGGALGANMLGAVLGGLLESVSLVVGMRALLLLAIVLYGLAGIGLLPRKPVQRSPVLPG